MENVADAGGWPVYDAGRYPADADNDGLSNAFEELITRDARSLSIDAATGYMWIENYANWLVGEYESCSPEAAPSQHPEPIFSTPCVC